MGGPGGGLEVLNSLPYALKAGAAVNALALPYLGGGAPGATFNERYQGERQLQTQQMAEYQAQHPEAAVAEQVAGGVLGSGAMVAAAPAAFGINAGASLGANVPMRS